MDKMIQILRRIRAIVAMALLPALIQRIAVLAHADTVAVIGQHGGEFGRDEASSVADDGGHDGDPGGLVGHEAVEEDDEDGRVAAGDVGAGEGGGGFVGEDSGRGGDFFGDCYGLEGDCHFFASRSCPASTEILLFVIARHFSHLNPASPSPFPYKEDTHCHF